MFQQVWQVFNAHFANAPDLVRIELLERVVVYLFHEDVITEMWRDSDESGKKELLDLEQHIFADVFKVMLQKVLTLFLLKYRCLSKLLHNNQYGYLGFLFDVLRLLMFRLRRNPIHNHLNYLHDKILTLLLGNVLFAQVQQGLDAFNLDWLLTEH